MPPKKRKTQAKNIVRRTTEFEAPVEFVKNWVLDRRAEGCSVRKILSNDESVRSMGIGAFYFAIEKPKKKPEPPVAKPSSRMLKIDLTKKKPVLREESESESDAEPDNVYPWGRFIVARASIFDVLEDNGIYVKKVKTQKADKLLRCAIANLMRRKEWYFENGDCDGSLDVSSNAYVIEQQLANARLLSSLETVLYGYVMGRLHERGLGKTNPMVFKQSASDKLKVVIDDSFDPHVQFELEVQAYVRRKLKKYDATAVAKAYVSTIDDWNDLSELEQFKRLYLKIEGKKKPKKKRAKSDTKSDQADLGKHGIPVEAERTIRYRVNKKYAEANGSVLLNRLLKGPDGKHFESVLNFLKQAKSEDDRKLDDFYDCLLHALFFAAHHWCVGGTSSMNYHTYIRSVFEAAGNRKNKIGDRCASDEESSSEDESDEEGSSSDEEGSESEIDPNADF